jgi:hypothetical protein
MIVSKSPILPKCPNKKDLNYLDQHVKGMDLDAHVCIQRCDLS